MGAWNGPPPPGVAAARTTKVRGGATACDLVTVAPALFELDDGGVARPVGDGIIPPSLAGQALLAQANCPELAVEIVQS